MSIIYLLRCFQGVSVAMQSALQEKQHLQERIRAENEAIHAHSAVLKLTTDEANESI